MLSDHIKQDIDLAFLTGGCLLLYKSSAESSCFFFEHLINEKEASVAYWLGYLPCKPGVVSSIPGFSSILGWTKPRSHDNFPGQTADKDIL